MSPNDDEVAAYNRRAWDEQARRGCRWTIPVDDELIERAKRGDWSVVLTPDRPVPRDWFPADLAGLRILALASGGGQQAAILAAAGAEVTLLDNSPEQLRRDVDLCRRHEVPLRAELGDMRDLERFADLSFDLCLHPCSNSFIPDPQAVWDEVARTLRPDGLLLAGFLQPVFWVFDDEAASKGTLQVRHSIPYSDQRSLSEGEQSKLRAEGEPLCFGHSLETQLRGQCLAGFVIEDLFEDRLGRHALDEFLPTLMATKARRVGR